MVSNAALPLFLVYIFLHAASSLSSNAFAPGDISVMVNGMPGKMALETAIVCLDRGYNVMPFGFTGPSEKFSKISVVGKTRSIEVELVKGPGLSVIASNVLQKLKEAYPNLVVIDYTHPSAVLNNLKCYKEENCDFVMGTTGEDAAEVKRIFDEGTNLAVIAPNMAKQIVALHASIISMAKRFPKSFKDYKLTVTESHQSTKADTSGTAKAIVSQLAILTDKAFGTDEIVQLRDDASSTKFGVPQDALAGHAFHTYRLESADKTVAFELKHNVCGRRVYAEGTADAVEFLCKVRAAQANGDVSGDKRMFNMVDVLESGEMD